MQPTVTILLSHFEQLKDEAKALRSGMIWVRDSNGVSGFVHKDEITNRLDHQARQIEDLGKIAGEHIALKTRVERFNKAPWYKRPFMQI